MIKFLLLIFPLCSFAHYNQLQKDVEYLSSPELSGRGIGTQGHRLAREFIVKRLKDLNYQVQIQNSKNIDPRRPNVHNIIASLVKKNKSNKCIVFSAHYDHEGSFTKEGQSYYYPGANDNASGVAALLSLAERVQDLDTGGTQVLFTFPDDEEHMLFGSTLMVPYLKKRCKKVLVNINLDMVGAKFFPGMENTLLALGSEYGKGLQQTLLSTNARGLNIIQAPVYLIEVLGLPRSDYASFRAQGIPFIFYTGGSPFHYHTTMDTSEHIDYQMMEDFVFHLQSLLTGLMRGQNTYSFKLFPKTKIKEDALKLCEVLDRLLENGEANKLTKSEFDYFNLMRKFLSFKYSPIRRAHIHQTVAMLIRTISSKNLSL